MLSVTRNVTRVQPNPNLTPRRREAPPKERKRKKIRRGWPRLKQRGFVDRGIWK